MDVLTCWLSKNVLSKVEYYASTWDLAESSVPGTHVLSAAQHWTPLWRGLAELMTLIHTCSSFNYEFPQSFYLGEADRSYRSLFLVTLYAELVRWAEILAARRDYCCSPNNCTGLLLLHRLLFVAWVISENNGLEQNKETNKITM